MEYLTQKIATDEKVASMLPSAQGIKYQKSKTVFHVYFCNEEYFCVCVYVCVSVSVSIFLPVC